MWSTALNREHSKSGRNREELWLNAKLFDANINKVSVWVCVDVSVDIDPAEQQDTYSAVSGKKLVSVFAVN